MVQEPDDLGISNGDMEDLADAADEILRHADRIYIINHRISGIEAVEWMDAYNKAVDGEIEGISTMLDFLHLFAERLQEMMDVPDSEISDYNAHALDDFEDDD